MLALALSALSGCLFLPTPEPVSPEQSGSHLAPIERLGRFDGVSFREIEPGSIPPSHVHVLVHGWEPGWGPAAVAFPRLRAWELTHGESAFEPWVSEMGHAILRADPHAIVLAYSWFDDAATGSAPLAQRRAFAHTELHGRWLAEALEQALGEGFTEGWGRVHLLGHSYGARVVALAAGHMRDKPQHLTFFDAPDAPVTYLIGTPMRLADILRELPLGDGHRGIFVDNYVASPIGASYHYLQGLSLVTDVVLMPPCGAFEQRRRHAYPMEFYVRTAGREVGLDWGPLTSRRTPQPGCFQQVYGELSVIRGCAGMP